MVPGSLEELVEPTLQAVLVFFAFAQCEDAGGCIPREGSPQGRAAGATQQHVEATGAGRLSAALGQTLSIAGQLRQQQHPDQQQDFLQDTWEQFTAESDL